MNNRSRLVALLLGILPLALTSSADERPKIGVSLPLSGDGANEGTDIQRLLMFANEHIADNRYEFIVEDDQCSDKEAVTIAQKFASVHKVKYVTGFACSGAVLAAAPIYEREKIVAMALATGAPKIADAGDYIFRTIPNLDTAATKLHSHAASRYQSIGIIAEETGYAQGMAQAFVDRNAASKLAVYRENFLSDTKDFRSLFSRLKSKGAQALLFLPQSENGLVTMYRQYRDGGWKVPVYGVYYPSFPLFLETFGNAADGIVFADLPFVQEALNPDGKRLYAEFIEKHGKLASSEFYFVTVLAGFQALHEAIRSGADAREFLYGKTISGVFGSFGFDQRGDVRGENLSFVLKKIEQGKVVRVD